MFLEVLLLWQVYSCVGSLVSVHFEVVFRALLSRRYKFSARKPWLTVYHALYVQRAFGQECRNCPGRVRPAGVWQRCDLKLVQVRRTVGTVVAPGRAVLIRSNLVTYDVLPHAT